MPVTMGPNQFIQQRFPLEGVGKDIATNVANNLNREMQSAQFDMEQFQREAEKSGIPYDQFMSQNAERYGQITSRIERSRNAFNHFFGQKRADQAGQDTALQMKAFYDANVSPASKAFIGQNWDYDLGAPPEGGTPAAAAAPETPAPQTSQGMDLSEKPPLPGIGAKAVLDANINRGIPASLDVEGGADQGLYGRGFLPSFADAGGTGQNINQTDLGFVADPATLEAWKAAEAARGPQPTPVGGGLLGAEDIARGGDRFRAVNNLPNEPLGGVKAKDYDKRAKAFAAATGAAPRFAPDGATAEAQTAYVDNAMASRFAELSGVAPPQRGKDLKTPTGRPVTKAIDPAAREYVRAAEEMAKQGVDWRSDQGKQILKAVEQRFAKSSMRKDIYETGGKWKPGTIIPGEAAAFLEAYADAPELEQVGPGATNQQAAADLVGRYGGQPAIAAAARNQAPAPRQLTQDELIAAAGGGERPPEGALLAPGGSTVRITERSMQTPAPAQSDATKSYAASVLTKMADRGLSESNDPKALSALERIQMGDAGMLTAEEDRALRKSRASGDRFVEALDTSGKQSLRGTIIELARSRDPRDRALLQQMQRESVEKLSSEQLALLSPEAAATRLQERSIYLNDQRQREAIKVGESALGYYKLQYEMNSDQINAAAKISEKEQGLRAQLLKEGMNPEQVETTIIRSRSDTDKKLLDAGRAALGRISGAEIGPVQYETFVKRNLFQQIGNLFVPGQPFGTQGIREVPFGESATTAPSSSGPQTTRGKSAFNQLK